MNERIHKSVGKKGAKRKKKSRRRERSKRKNRERESKDVGGRAPKSLPLSIFISWEFSRAGPQGASTRQGQKLLGFFQRYGFRKLKTETNGWKKRTSEMAQKTKKQARKLFLGGKVREKSRPQGTRFLLLFLEKGIKVRSGAKKNHACEWKAGSFIISRGKKPT